MVQPEETLTTALRLQPSTKHVVVVGGVGTYDRHLEDIVKQSLRNYESRLEITYLTDLDMPTLLRRLGQLPSNTIVLYTSIFQDAAGRHFIDANQSSPVVIDASNAPVFVLFDVNFGTGRSGETPLALPQMARLPDTWHLEFWMGNSHRVFLL